MYVKQNLEECVIWNEITKCTLKIYDVEKGYFTRLFETVKGFRRNYENSCNTMRTANAYLRRFKQ